ncbi:hypothetical protein [Dyella sp.]|jgi:hypothetical protein|uniref:hypothetical protein n=1 Tax=Dyella sp. TaxID=1869338 RepID=UPI002B458FBC|nr:hypothetical protein [Dyella sp.]HKT29495.1 hypothetical protein [Dyella sp.]
MILMAHHLTELITPAAELIRHVEALRQRLDALDAASTGIAEGMRRNVLHADAAYQLLDVISADLKARADLLLQLLSGE